MSTPECKQTDCQSCGTENPIGGLHYTYLLSSHKPPGAKGWICDICEHCGGSDEYNQTIRLLCMGLNIIRKDIAKLGAQKK